MLRFACIFVCLECEVDVGCIGSLSDVRDWAELSAPKYECAVRPCNMEGWNASGDTIVFVSARRVETIQRETLRGLGDFHRTIEKVACNSKGVSSNACARHV